MFNLNSIKMRTLFIVVLALTAQIAIAQAQKTAQEPITFINFGVSVYGVDANESSSAGIGFGMAFENVYFDISSNLSTGKGEELEFSSSYTKKSNKLQVNLINFGYAIRMNKTSIIPLVGYGWTREIYEDDLAFDTYYFGKSEGSFNLGVMGVFDLFDNGGLYVGAGIYENFKAGIWIGL